MLILCRFSIIVSHLLLLTHIARSFVLLTANVEDVKKIARKFVSDSLAEKIVDFIARATKNITEERKATEENETQESFQVSAENKRYNIKRTRNDQTEESIHSDEEEGIALGKETVVLPKKSQTEKKGHKEKKHKDKEIEIKVKETDYKNKEYKENETDNKAKETEDREAEYKDEEYKDKELEYKNKELEHKNKEYKDKETEYKDKEKEYKDKEKEYKDKEYNTDKETEQKDKELEYKNKEYKDKESEYKDKENENKDKEYKDNQLEYNDKDYKDKEAEYTHKETESTENIKSSKPRKHAPKPLHRRSRYIDQEETETTEKPNINDEDNYKNLKEPAIKYVEDDEDSTASETKDKQQNNESKKDNTFHSLDSADAETVGISDDKAKEEKPFTEPNNNEITTAEENNPSNNNIENVSEKAVNELDDYDTEKSKTTVNTAKVSDENDFPKIKETGSASNTPLKENYDYDDEINNIIPTGEKVATSGSLVKDKDADDDRWWEKELPTHKQDVAVQAKGKSWF